MKYLVLGAGPAGLSAAARLIANGQKDVVVLEREDEAGGLCRSRQVDGSPLDIGDGHFLDVKRPEVNDFLFEYLPQNEWEYFGRNSKIVVNGKEINSPIEANIWQFDLNEQVQYLKSIAAAGCNRGDEMPEKFVDWIYWKLGDKIAEDYMLPYNRKMFGNNLNELGTYWLAKLPNVSFEETLTSCLTKKAYGEQPGHANFLYPKHYGYGEVWKRMALSMEKNIKYGVKAAAIDLDKKVVNNEYEADVIITTVPWTSFETVTCGSMETGEYIGRLKSTSVTVDYYAKRLNTDAQWVYYPAPELSYHRILVRHNFCSGSRGYWTETNTDRVDADAVSAFRYTNEYAYPLNTVGKDETMSALLALAAKRNVIGLGRWGEWQHYNSDVVVERAIRLADKLSKY